MRLAQTIWRFLKPLRQSTNKEVIEATRAAIITEYPIHNKTCQERASRPARRLSITGSARLTQHLRGCDSDTDTQRRETSRHRSWRPRVDARVIRAASNEVLAPFLASTNHAHNVGRKPIKPAKIMSDAGSFERVMGRRLSLRRIDGDGCEPR